MITTLLSYCRQHHIVASLPSVVTTTLRHFCLYQTKKFVSCYPFCRQIAPKNRLKLQLTVRDCKGVNYIEHVQAKITLTSQRRGDIQIFLTSPAGTRVTLLTSR